MMSNFMALCSSFQETSCASQLMSTILELKLRATPKNSNDSAIKVAIKMRLMKMS